jgi:hypothetical protein
MNASRRSLTSKRRAVPLRSLIIALLVTIALTSIFWNALYLWRKTPVKPAAPPLGLRVECPERVGIGDMFDLKLVLKNAGQKELLVSTLDFDDSLIKGMEVISIAPEPYGRVDERSYIWYKFAQPIGARKTFEFVFRLQAKTKGTYKGDVDVYSAIDGRLSTVVVSTLVE